MKPKHFVPYRALAFLCIALNGCRPSATDQVPVTPVENNHDSAQYSPPAQLNTPSDELQGKSDLTAEQKVKVLQYAGYPTDGSWDVKPSNDGGYNIVKADPVVSLPPNTHYMITRKDGVFGGYPDIWFCKDEPKPYGSGYKFTDIYTGSEQVVTGEITVSKIH